MKWIHSFNLFLFDFDGLLVNTEYLHYQAYLKMCERRGCQLDWSFEHYCQEAHLEINRLKETLYDKFPQLYEKEPRWSILYEEKQEIYFDLLKTAQVEMMPGAERLLVELDRARIKSCVVTNSYLRDVNFIKATNPTLKRIDHWITREDYIYPKPNPECYLRAISLYSCTGDRMIGFEDTLKGLQALEQTPALPVLISPFNYPQIEGVISKSVLHFSSLEDIKDEFLL